MNNKRTPHRTPPRPRRDTPGAQRRPTAPRPPKLRVVHEDGDTIVVDKPVGLLTASSTPTDEPTLFDLATRHMLRHGSKRVRLWTIHRLDRDASGLVVFAKSTKAAEHLREELRTQRVHRLFAAVVEGTFDGGDGARDQSIAGIVQDPIRENRDGSVTVVPLENRHSDADAKPAVTHYRVEAQSATHALLKVRLKTGRKYQVRAHLASIGHPIAGDRDFDASANPIRRLALHATELGFVHPTTRDSVRFSSPAPPALRGLIDGQPERSSEDRHHNSDDNRGQKPPADNTSWQAVAEWYGEYQSSARSDHFERVIEPGAERLLGDLAGKRVLDVACGEGSFARRLAESGAHVVGIDAAEDLVGKAQSAADAGLQFVTHDARAIETLEHPEMQEPFDAACCIMAMMNIDPIDPVLAGIASKLQLGAPFVAVILHPAFRSPKRTGWGWTDGPAADQRQHRIVDAYLSPSSDPIVMNPGKAAAGEKPITTWTFHRPLEHYVRAFATAGLLIDAVEEWPSRRTSQPGPRAAEENRARREIPMFMGIRAVKTGRTDPA
ncbi:MAG: pseudouridine synthase [Planctomycetota bacterium]